ncbi:MAG: hypothetical protein ACLUGJ_01310 [Blautia wexlerae]
MKFGESLADAAVEGGEQAVGIFSGNQSQLGMRQRLKAVKQRLEEAGVEIAWVLSEKELYKKIRNSGVFYECIQWMRYFLWKMMRQKRQLI